MFQGMFRKRGRPPEPPLQIGGYDKPSHEESNQIPAHQLRDAPRQLPLPAVREFEQNAVIQQEQPGFNNAIVESSSSQQGQHDVDMLDSYNRLFEEMFLSIRSLFFFSQGLRLTYFWCWPHPLLKEVTFRPGSSPFLWCHPLASNLLNAQ